MMSGWLDETMGALASVLPYVLGVIGLLLLISLIDGRRKRDSTEEHRDED